MLEASPGAVVALAGIGPAAPRAAVRAGSPRIESERGAVVRTEAAVGREQRLHRRDDRSACQERRRAFRQSPCEGREVGRPAEQVAPGDELVGAQHGRTPSAAHRTGRRIPPSARAASVATAVSSGPRKNIAAARARARRLAAERAGLAHRVTEPSHQRRAHAGIERLLVPPVAVEQRADAREVAGLERLDHPLGDVPQAVQRRRHGAITALVGRHDAADGRAGEVRRAGIDQQHTTLELVEQRRVERQRLDDDIGVSELQPQKAAERRGELVLAPAGNSGLHPFESAGKLGDLARIAALAPRGRQRGHDARRRARRSCRARSRVARPTGW